MAYDKTFQAKVWPVIIEVLEASIMSVFDGRLYSKVASSLNTFPLGVYQSQDGGGKNDDYINQNGWLGQVTIRSLALTHDGAWEKALAVAVALQTASHDDYDISIDISNPIDFPIERLTIGSVYTAGLIITMGIYPKT